MRRVVVAIGSFLLVLAWAGPAGAATKTVSAKEYSFAPTPIRVAQGVAVEWKNDGTIDHTSTQNDSLHLWNTGSIAPGDTADVTMASAGTFLFGVVRRNKTFTPTAAGTYSFRSRLHRTSNDGVSRFSPPATITVAAA